MGNCCLNCYGELLSKLLLIAYRATFMRDEGRQVRFNIFSPADLGSGPPMIVSFRNSLEFDERLLKQLAPVLTSEKYALGVREISGKLICDGIYLMIGYEHDIWIPPSNEREFDGCHGLVISALDVGELAIAEGGARFHLRHNTIDHYFPRLALLVAHDWLTGLTDRIFQTCREETPTFWKALDYPLWETSAIWSAVLSTAESLGHGATFVILDDPSVEEIRIGFPTNEVKLRDRIVEYWLARSHAESLKEKPGFEDASKECNRLRRLIFAEIRLLGSVSATDG